MSRSRFLSWFHRLIVIGSFVAFAKILLRPLRDPDLWWHLASGRAMVESHVFLRTDIFSRSMLGVRWVNAEWLTDILFFLGHASFGVNFFFFGRVLGGLVIMLVIYECIREIAPTGPWNIFFLWLSFALISPRMNERAELFSFLFLGSLTLVVIRRRNAFAAWRVPAEIVVGALGLVWANTHPGFVYGLGLLLSASVGALWAREERRFSLQLLRCAIVFAASSLINPNGLGLYRFFLEHTKQMGPTGIAGIAEWNPTDIEHNKMFWVWFFMIAVAAVTSLLRGSLRTRFWIPSALLFAVWGSVHTRNTVFVLFPALPLLMDFLSNEHTGLRRRQILHIAAVASIFSFAWKFWSEISAPLPPSKISWQFFPKEAVRFLEDENISGDAWNAYEFGGYLEWARGPQHKIFMDGRYLFQPLLKEQLEMFSAPSEQLIRERWQLYWKRYPTDYAVSRYLNFRGTGSILELNPLNFMFPRSDWALVFWDDSCLVFLKRNKLNERVIASHEYKWLWPYNLYQMRQMLKNKEVLSTDCADELKRHEQETGGGLVHERLAGILAGS